MNERAPPETTRPAWTESERQAALDRYQILDTASEADFDDIARIAAQICGVPIALISLLDNRRQWFKARLGLDATETPREVAFCEHAIHHHGILEVDDAHVDRRFADNALVTGAPHVRFYAGAPLITPDGFPLGTLCVLDREPHHLSEDQRSALAALARQVMAQLELRRAAAELKVKADRESDASERLQLALAAGAIVGTWFWDVPAHRFIADERFAQSFGLPTELCRTGLPIDRVVASIHDDDRARVTLATDDALRRGGAYRCEYRVLQHDGVYRWIEANGRVEVDAGGRPMRFPGVLLDIESRRVAESERDRMSALLQTFFLAVPGVVYAKDFDGRMIVANNGTTELIGRPPGFYVGRTDLEFLDDKEQAARIMATDRRIMESGVAEQVEEEIRRTDGTPMTWLSTKEPLFDEAGEVVGLVGSSVDVTARKNAEAEVRELNRTLERRVAEAVAEREAVQEALRQSQKMEAVGQLTGGLAHDFNNLLTGMMGNLELLQLRIARGRTEDLTRFVLAAQGAGRRAASLTQRLLAFSRRQTLDPKPADVNRLVAGMEDLLRRTVGPAINLEVVGAVGLWVANIDAGQLENALLNLCINARDAMPHGGRITVETANRWLDDRGARQRDLPPGQYLSLCVTDTGTGMSAETIERAFEPFYTTKPIGQGTGLGLSMIYGFARQSGGQVRIHSELGEGTTVCIDLPRHLGDAAEVEFDAESSSIAGVRGQTVLVVDDESTIRDLIEEVLGDLDYTVLGAADGAAGLKVIQSGAKVDLLITDVGLPNGMNGRQVADAARAIRPDLKVLFVTGYAENAALGNGHLEPGMALLTKPFTLEALSVKVSEMLTSRG